MKTKLQIKSIFGNLLFEYESDNNSILTTLKEAIEVDADLRYANLSNADLSNADLRYANLRYANLSNADLSNADLRYANLRYANLRYANLSNADLSNADLRYANLRYANLSNADLSNADLSGADLSNAENKELACMPQFCKWSHSILGDKIQIGCKKKTIEEWQYFFNSTEEYSTKRGTDEFKQIQAIFESYKAYLNHLKS